MHFSSTGSHSSCFVALLLAILMFMPAEIYAHTRLLSSEPPAGAALKSAPGHVVLHFSAPPEPGFTSIQWASSKSDEWHKVEAAQLGGEVEALLPDLAPGRYKIRWSVLSRDGHRQRGVLEFQIH
jgi:methionine-rich copper-binding protein CopC